MIFVCGIHGVGKTHFCRKLAEKTGRMVFSASSLIKRNVKDDFKEKQVDSIQDTQTVLLNDLRKLTLQTPDYILDGHLCLLDNKNKIHRIDMKFIKQMSISSIILLVDSPAEIKKNLEERDGLEWSENFIEQFQNSEIKYAKEISKKLDVNLQILLSQQSEKVKFGESILLPIKPQYAEKILCGEKRYEYRTRLCNKNIDKIYLYSTYPVRAVVGECEVVSKYEMQKPTLWELTEQFSGITRQQYYEYFSAKKIASAYGIGTIKRYDVPVLLEDFGIHYVPQSYAYVKTRSYL